MKTEEIIMLVFLCIVVIGLPTILWLIERDRKRQEQEEWNRGRKK